MSILRATLSKEAQSNFTLFYGNKTNQTIIFNSDLEDLKKEYPNRFQVYHILSRVDDVQDKFKGRLSAEKCKAFHNDLIDLKKLDDLLKLIEKEKRDLNSKTPIAVKVSPDISDKEITQISEVLLNNKRLIQYFR